MSTAHIKPARHEKARSNAPIFWSMFGAGGMLSALIGPALVFITGIAVPLGFLIASGTMDYAHMLAFARHWLGKIFIFAVIAEELGLAGGALVLMAFLLMVGSGLRIATRADHAFDKLLATGLTLLLGVQAFIIVAGVLRVLPLTGVTLPFVSYGGSSLVVNYVLLALLLRISDHSERARKPVPMTMVAA